MHFSTYYKRFLGQIAIAVSTVFDTKAMVFGDVKFMKINKKLEILASYSYPND